MVANVASFYFGVQFGAEEMKMKYEVMLNKDKKPDRSKDKYHQEFIVSYYYNVFAPNRQFEEKWFELYDALLYNDTVSNLEDNLDDLETLATDSYKEVQKVSMPAASSLLVDAQKNTLKSLSLFADAIGNVKTGAEQLSQANFLRKLGADANFIEARNFSLLARSQYFGAISEWNKTINAQLKGSSFVNKKDLTISEWKLLNLNLKNQVVAQMLANKKTLTLALPQDYVGRVDELNRNGRMQELKFKTISEVLNMLVATNAVRNGDFGLMRERFYGDEFVPAIPFFTN
jgi:hypothetical protein